MPTDSALQSPNFATLLGPEEPPPFERLWRTPSLPVLLVCDHAAARVPAALGTLGLGPEHLADHIALDIGAAALTRALAGALGLPAILTAYSRLVVDCNRRLDDPTAFPECSDGRRVPGNAGLAVADRQLRAESLYWPYHHRVRDDLRVMEAYARAPALVAIHSFTPRIDGQQRPWHAGILWDKDPRIPVPLMKRLAGDPALCIGDNQPYSGQHPADFTIDHHAEAEGLPHVSIEVRQDLITTAEGVHQWTRILTDALRPILADPALYQHWPGNG